MVYNRVTFRFDKDVKQWKERGVGDIKILHHQAKNTFRVILRREQVHKIACNHYISPDQKLEPMQRLVLYTIGCKQIHRKRLQMSLG